MNEGGPSQAEEVEEDRLEHSRVLHILIAGRLLAPMWALIIGLAAQPIMAVLIYLDSGHPATWAVLAIVFGTLSIVAAIVGAERLRSQLLNPLVRLEQSVFEVCQGEPASNPPLENVGVLGAVMQDIDSLSDELEEVYEDMDNRVARQTRRLAQQTTFLKVLYDVAAYINHANSLDELLIRFLHVLKKMLNGRSAAVSLIAPDGRLRLVGSVDEQDVMKSGSEQLPIRLCECGKALTHGDQLCPRDPQNCASQREGRILGLDRIEMLEVPLEYHDDRFGVYHVFFDKGITISEEFLDLLSTIGHHLGMAVAKHRSDEEARRLSIVQERTNMAHELHDSLAQTLASLRFQVRMLEDSLGKDKISIGARGDLLRIRNGLDEAHTELRELLNSFLAPLEQRGLIRSLEKLAERFRQDEGIPIFFQYNCNDQDLTSSEELQMLRIVQECLANTRKHAGAQNVRILFSRHGGSGYRLLIEDDGVGFDDEMPKGRPGEHIGLSIMEERASKLGGELTIDSEPGEGTRVELIYDPSRPQQ
jgi:two-component system nitrate/nitrite sensor histidine kinase NarX